MIPNSAYRLWQRWWVQFAGQRGARRVAARLAAWHTMPYHCRAFLADLHPRGFICPSARIAHPDFRLGLHVYVGDGVFAFRSKDGGAITLHDRVHLYGNSQLQTGTGGSITIGAGTHVQPGCHFSAFLVELKIGREVEIAPECAFYSYDHGVAPDRPIMHQPLQSKGEIVVGDGAWLGHGVVVLHGITIGEGAVVGARSVVARSIPAGAIAVGAPARVIGYRDGRRASPALSPQPDFPP